MDERGLFAGGDQDYLREVQYRNSSKLASRANLHATYGRGDWFPWWAGQVPWPAPTRSGATEVLEVGCGAGWLWAEGAGAIPADLHLTLTDLSAGMVDEALARAVGTGHYGEVHAQVADAGALPFEAGSFDVVAANHMLYHLPDPRRAVAELARVVRTEGVVAVATNGRIHLGEMWAIRGAVYPGMTAHDETTDVFGIETGEPILHEHFASVELTRYPDRLRCTDPDDVLAFVTSTPPAEDATPAELEALHHEIATRFDQGNGVLEITKDVGLFICRDPRGVTRAG